MSLHIPWRCSKRCAASTRHHERIPYNRCGSRGVRSPHCCFVRASPGSGISKSNNFYRSHFPLPLRSPRARSLWFRCVSQRRRGPLCYPCHSAGNAQSGLGHLEVVPHSIKPLAGCLDRPQLKLLEGDFHLLPRLHPEQLLRQSGVTFYVYRTFHSIYFSNFVP